MDGKIGSMSAMASMRRPVGVKWVLLFFSLDKVFLPAELPLSPPFHPHSSMSGSYSLGASWVFSFQPVLPPVSRPLGPSMPNELETYREGPNAFEFKGTNGFLLTFDMNSKDDGRKPATSY
jgi:hypothetical protein